MYNTNSREKVLANIRNSLTLPANAPFSSINKEPVLYKSAEDPDEINFAIEFKSLGGNFIFCTDENEFCNNLIEINNAHGFEYIYCRDDNLIEFLKRCNIPYFSKDEKLLNSYCSLTQCEYLISRTGSILVSAYNKSDRRKYFSSPYHFVVAYSSQIVKDLNQAFKKLRNKYNGIPDFVTVITGPSRTADIEKTLVMGAHGPKELFVFLIDDNG